MENNLIVSYKLEKTDHDPRAITKAIFQLEVKHLAKSVRVESVFDDVENQVSIFGSIYYVRSSKTAEEAVELISPLLDKNDKLLVVDASNNRHASLGLSPEQEHKLSTLWID
jgi:hypothetical protein